MEKQEVQNLFDVTGKVAVITGATGGFGRAVAIGLAMAGVKVMVTGRSEETLNPLVEEIEKAIGKREEVERIREIISTSGALDKAKEKSGEHAAKAVELLDQTDLDDATKDFFTSLIDYVAGSLDWYR